MKQDQVTLRRWETFCEEAIKTIEKIIGSCGIVIIVADDWGAIRRFVVKPEHQAATTLAVIELGASMIQTLIGVEQIEKTVETRKRKEEKP